MDEPVEVVEKAEEVKAKLDKALFLVVWEGAENLGRIVHVILVPDSAEGMNLDIGDSKEATYLLTLKTSNGALSRKAVH